MSVPDPRCSALVLVATGILIVSLAPVGGAQPEPKTDNTITRIDVGENGSARWIIRIRTRLDSADRVREYETFQRAFRRNTTRYLGPFHDRMRRVVDRAGNATGRPMTATDFTASTSIQEVPRRWGIVTFTFRWSGFAVRTDGRLVAGDVFQGGFFLTRNDTLEITAPERYRIVAVAPGPDERTQTRVTWVGREDFPDRRPRVEFAESMTTPASSGATAGTPAGGTSGGTSGGNGGPPATGPPARSLGWLAIVLGGALVMAVIGGAILLHRRRAAGASPAPEGEDRSRSTDDPVTDAERVQTLLETAGGRMRQADIADELGWTASKTSRVIGRLAEDGTVEKLQLGRENLIDLPDDE